MNARAKELHKRVQKYVGYLKKDPKKAKEYATIEIKTTKAGREFFEIVDLLEKDFLRAAKRFDLLQIAMVAVYITSKKKSRRRTA